MGFLGLYIQAVFEVDFGILLEVNIIQALFHRFVYSVQDPVMGFYFCIFGYSMAEGKINLLVQMLLNLITGILL